MNNSNGALNFDALINNSQFQRSIQQMERQMNSLTNTVSSDGDKIDGVFKKIGNAAAGVFAFAGAKTLISDIVRVRGEFQQLDIALTTMLGNKQNADKLMGELVTFASTTPFGLKETAQAAKSLLAYGSAADDVKSELRTLGDVASGVSVPIGDLVYLYGTLRTQGRAYAVDIRQFAGRGIPIYAELAKVLGVNKDEVNALVEAGKVGFPEVQKAFENMTGAGGQFGGLMEAQSKSIPGQIERLKDSFDQLYNKIGTEAQPIIEGTINGIASLVENYETVGKVLAVLVATYGTYRAALMVTAAAQSLVASSTVASSYLQMAAGLGTVTMAHRARAVALGIEAAAQRVLNTVMSANPYVLVATAAVGLATAIWLTYDATTAEEKAQERLNGQLSELAQIKEKLSSETTSLINTIRSETESVYEQVKAYDRLREMYPELFANMTMEQIKLADIKQLTKEVSEVQAGRSVTDLSKKYDEELLRLKELKQLAESMKGFAPDDELARKYAKEYKDINEAIEVAENNVRALGQEQEKNNSIAARAAEIERVKALPLEQQLAYHRQIQKELEVEKSALENSLLLSKQTGQSFSLWQQGIDAIRLDGLNRRISDTMALIKGLLPGSKVKDQSYWEGEQKRLKEDYGKEVDTSTVKAKAIRKAYQEATKELEKYNLTEKKSPKAKKIDIELPAGSLAEISRQLQKAEEALSKIPATQIERVKAMQQTILDLTEQQAEAKKIIEIRSFDEQLDYQEQQYKKYEDMVSLLGKNAADSMFAELLQNGASFAESLDKQLNEGLDKFNNGTLSEKEQTQLVTVQLKYNDITGATSALDQFKERIENIKTNTDSLAEALGKIKEESDKLNSEDAASFYSPAQIEKRKQLLLEAEKDIQKQMASQLKSFLEQVKGSEEQRLAIVKKYADLRAAAIAQNKPTLSIDASEKKELQDLAFETSEAFKAMNDVIMGEGVKAQEAFIEKLKELYKVAVETYGETSNEAKELFNQINRESQSVAEFKLNNWAQLAQILGQAGGELAEMQGALGAIGSLLVGAANGAQTFAQNLAYANKVSNGNGSTGETVGAVASGVGSLVGMFVNSRKRKKAERKQRELNEISFQVQMNAALNEEIRLRTILSENVYFKDYGGRIQDAMGAATDAVNKYNSALLNLMDNGKALEGTKNTIDWGNVAGGALSGAGTGAVAGAAIGGGVLSVPASIIGAVIGGVVGAAVGLISQATKSLYGPLLAQYPQLINANGELNKSLAETLIATDQVDEKTKIWLQDLINAADAYAAAKEQITEIVSELTGSLGTELRDTLVDAFIAGEDAAYKFGQVVEKTLENALSNLIYSAIFSKAFSNLQKNLEDSLMGSGRSFADVFGEFLSQSDELTKQFNEAMKAAQEEAKKRGLDIFDPNDIAGNPNSLSGAIQGVTEQTANVLSGQLNAIRIGQAQQFTVLNTNLPHLFTIANHTRYLISIDKRLALMGNQSLRPFGIEE